MELLRNRMWHELCSTKYTCKYLAALVVKHRKIHLIINGLIAFFSTLGLTLQQRFDWAATAGLAVSLLGIFSKHIGPFWLMSDDQLTSLDREHAFYELYLSQLERLWIHFEQESKTESEVLQEFYILKDRESEHVVALNQLSAYFRINTNLIHKQANDYVKAVFTPQIPDPASP